MKELMSTVIGLKEKLAAVRGKPFQCPFDFNLCLVREILNP